MNTSRYARESHTRAYLANVSISAPMFVLQKPHEHHISRITPTLARFVPLLLAHCACCLVARTSPTDRWGRGSSGMHSLVPFCSVHAHAALSSDVPPKGWRGSTGVSSMATLLPSAGCSVRCATALSSDAPHTERWGRGSTGGTTVPHASPPVSFTPPCVHAIAGR